MWETETYSVNKNFETNNQLHPVCLNFMPSTLVHSFYSPTQINTFVRYKWAQPFMKHKHTDPGPGKQISPQLVNLTMLTAAT
ncbi:hypothetical protein FKM82_014340 [Ascaphus truei]